MWNIGMAEWRGDKGFSDKKAKDGGKDVEEFLADGWEPFAATQTNRGVRSQIWFRKEAI